MKRNILARRAASAALAACMMFSLSAPALAASTDALLQQSTAAKSAVSVLDEENDMTEEEPAYQMNLKYGSITVYIGADDKQYVQQGNNEAQQKGNLSITTDGSQTHNTITIKGGTMGAKVTLSNVNIETTSNAAVSVSGNVELVIAGTNTLQSGPKHAGVEKADDNGTLTISGFGTLNAYGGESGAGIGGAWHKNASNIVIEGGTIEANGGNWGAGIGGGQSAAGQNITIRDGDVTAIPGGEAAGIGGGYQGSGKNITIEGGTVYSRSGGGSGPVAAIGGGRVYGKGENIQITGGNVTLKTVDDDDIYIGNGQEEAKIDPSKLLGTITKLDKDGNQVDEIVQDFKITINDTPVTRKNYEDILEDGVLYYNIEEKTLKLKDGKSFEGALTITAPEDVSIDLEANARHVVNGNLTVTGAKDVKVTKLKGDDAAEEAIVAINGKAEISCSGDVILQNWGGDTHDGRNLTKYGLTVQANTVTTEGGINGEAIIDCIGDIKLGNEWGTTVSKLTVKNADNVTVTSGSVYRSIEDDVDITCSGTVEIKGKKPINVKVIFTQAGNKPYVYFTDESSEEYKDSRITPIPETIGRKYLRIEPRETYSITVANGTAQVVGDTDGKLTTAFEGEKVTVSGKNRNPDVTKFGGWKVVSPEGFELTEEQKNTEKNMTFTMPASPVELKASYSFPAPVLDMQVTVKGGTIRVGEGESQTGTVFVQPGQTVTIEANEPAKENESFHHWKVEKDSSKNIGIIEGSLGSETEKGTEKIVFTMPQDGVKLTAVYSIPASVLKSTVTVTGGTAKSTLGEGSDIPAEIGTTVEITATPYDAEKYPGMEFVEWEIVYPDSFYEKFPGGIPENLQLKLDNAKSATTTFKMPVYPVKLIAHWSASAVADPDEPIDEDFGVEPAPMDTTGGTIAAVAVGGAAIWGGYEIATRVILHDLLPEGAAIPANRGQLALLIWTEKGKPEPAAQPAFADITDAEQAKAAQWCVEQGLLDAREGKFESDGWMPKFKTIEIWNKAFPQK
ncbi:MAG: InlB B-repeat-containing protein [Faecalibacterium sp.]